MKRCSLAIITKDWCTHMLKVRSEHVRRGSNEVGINENRNWLKREWNPIWLRKASNSNSTRVDLKMNRDAIGNIVEAQCRRWPSVLTCWQLATKYYVLLVLLLPGPNTCDAKIILHSKAEYDAQPQKKKYGRPKGPQRRLLLRCGAIGMLKQMWKDE